MPRLLLPIIISLGLLTLVNCGGDKPNDALARNCAVERTVVDRFSVCLPDGWSIQTEQFGDVGSFVVMVQREEGTETLMQIHVKKDPLNEPVLSPMAFAQRGVEIARETAPNYRAISTNPITVGRKETVLHIFDASPDPKSEPIRYYQFVTTNEGIAYGFTAVMAPETDDGLRTLLVDVFTNVIFT
jgi:hypothetical protein